MDHNIKHETRLLISGLETRLSHLRAVLRALADTDDLEHLRDVLEYDQTQARKWGHSQRSL